MKILLTYDYGKERMQSIKDLGFDYICLKEKSATYSPLLDDVEVLCCYSPFNTLDISKLPNLKWIQLSSTGFDQVPRAAVEEKHIIITNNKYGYAIPIGEWIVLKTLELLKKTRDIYRNQDNRRWHMEFGLEELYGRTMLFIGTGGIPSEAAKRLQGFEVNIIGVNTDGRSMPHFHQCYPISKLDNLIQEADFVVMTLPSTPETYHILDSRLLRSMKPSSYLINISRGSVIDQTALYDVLKDHRIAGAALDVFEHEPLPKESLLWDLDNLLISSHTSWISERMDDRKFEVIYENLKLFKEGRPLKNIVNLNRGY
jgi:phosphoglycerate dehydrogenase-like enzyme